MSPKEPILLIPLCGNGQRFRDAGIIQYKALINIYGENMLSRIIKKFPKSVEIFLITTKEIKTKLESNLKEFIKLKSINFIIIDSHKLGPAYSIYKALKFIPNENPIFISYCDILWQWKDGFPFDLQNKSDATIFVHSGFHPHLIKNSFSAFCKIDKLKQKFIEIKEKGSYTNQWMDEILSIGLFFIKRKKSLEIGIKELIESKRLICGEYYPSLIFNILEKKNIKVDLLFVKSFVHYGTPEQLNDFLNWQNYFNSKQKKIEKKANYKSLLLAAGNGSRMAEISNEAKPFIKIGEKFLIEKIFEELPISESDSQVVINESMVKPNSFNSSSTIIKIKKTNSQLDTLFTISDKLQDLDNFFLCSCDCFGTINSKLLFKYINNKNYDYICFGFQPTLLQSKIKGHTFFSSYKNEVEKVYVKNKSNKNDLGLAGFFWIKDGSRLLKYIEYVKENKIIERELIIDDVISEIIISKQKVGWIRLENYFHLGSSEEFREYNYWEENMKSLISKYE